MKFQGFVGPSYQLDSINVDCQRSVNLYVEGIESGTGKEGQQAFLKSTPGFEQLFTVGDGPIRMVLPIAPHRKPGSSNELENPTNTVLIVSGNKLYRCLQKLDGTWYVGAVSGTLLTSSGPVRGLPREALDPGDVPVDSAVFVDGAATYLWTRSYGSIGYQIDGSTVTFNGSSGDPAAPYPEFVALIDGFYIFNEKDSGRFYVSRWGQPLVDPLDFASSEGDPDKLLALIASMRKLFLFNERSLEIFANTGNADFPFERIPGGYFEKGLLAPSSVSEVDGNVSFLGRDKAGQGIVYTTQGGQPQRISTHAVENAIARYANPKSATSYSYQFGGHAFYVLNFDEGTWVYDYKTGLWHERAATVDGELVRHRGQYLGFSPELNMHIMSDFENNKVYALKKGIFHENNQPLTRMRRFPHVSGGGNRCFVSRLGLDMQTGVGLDGSGQGSDPQIFLRMSKDNGYTWSSEAWASLGKKIGGIGEFSKRVYWNRLGSFRDCVFEVKVSDPVDVTMIAADIELTVGSS